MEWWARSGGHGVGTGEAGGGTMEARWRHGGERHRGGKGGAQEGQRVGTGRDASGHSVSGHAACSRRVGAWLCTRDVQACRGCPPPKGRRTAQPEDEAQVGGGHCLAVLVVALLGRSEGLQAELGGGGQLMPRRVGRGERREETRAPAHAGVGRPGAWGGRPGAWGGSPGDVGWQAGCGGWQPGCVGLQPGCVGWQLG